MRKMTLGDRTLYMNDQDYEDYRAYFRMEAAKEEAAKLIDTVICTMAADHPKTKSLREHREAYIDALAMHVPGAIEAILRRADQADDGLFVWAQGHLDRLYRHKREEDERHVVHVR